MSLAKLFNRIFFHNNTTPALNEDNLNAMSKAIDDIDDRVIGLAGTIMEDVPQIQEDIEDLQEAEATFNAAIQSAQDAATNAQNSANAAAGSVTSAQQKALIAEGWAKGTQNGSPVSQSSPYWENNAEYWAGKARSFTPEGYQDLVDDVDDLKQTLNNLTETISDNEAYVLRHGKGNMADMELVGGSLAWNQLVENGNFESTSGWVAINTSISVSNNIATITATSANITQGLTKSGNSYVPSHKYLVGFGIKSSNTTAEFGVSLSSSSLITNNVYSQIKVPSSWTRYEKVVNVSSESNGIRISTYTNAPLAVNDTFNLRDVNVIDLTQALGSEIADYIYSLEQATAGAGVAWFRKYFPNAYYGYQSGKIESVNVASRKVIGFNQWDEQLELGMYNTETGEKTPTTATLRNVNKIDVFPNTVYYCCSNILIRYLEYDANGKYLGTNTTTNTTFRTQKDTAYLNIQCGLDYKYICINISKTTGSPKNGDYVPYNGAEFPFANKQLRGIPKLVDNKLSYDGDIWKANEGITRKYGVVDLGTLTWTATNADGWSQEQTSIGAKRVDTSEKANLICTKYLVDSANNVWYRRTDKTICINNTGVVQLYDLSLANKTAAEIKTALNGVYLVYELATPTTESATAFQNPQRAFIDGTEEFVDYGVQSATRDVSIPVGNNTTYQLNETLPPIEDYVDGAVKFKVAISALGTDESGRTTASRAYTTGEFFYKDGKMYKVLASIASGATFTVGTNCQQTTLFAELKALA